MVGNTVKGLRIWMLRSIDEGDYAKAYKIRKVLGKLTLDEFYSECHADILIRHFQASANYSQTVGIDADVLAEEIVRTKARLGTLIEYMKEAKRIEFYRDGQKN